jgi:hypothetical protein
MSDDQVQLAAERLALALDDLHQAGGSGESVVRQLERFLNLRERAKEPDRAALIIQARLAAFQGLLGYRPFLNCRSEGEETARLASHLAEVFVNQTMADGAESNADHDTRKGRGRSALVAALLECSAIALNLPEGESLKGTPTEHVDAVRREFARLRNALEDAKSQARAPDPSSVHESESTPGSST